MNTQKKTALLMWQLLLLIALLAAALPAYSYFEYNGLFYLVNSGTQKTVTVAKSFYEGYYKGNIVIPEIAIDDETNTSYTVTAINRNAFSNCRELTSVTIGDSVTFISHGAFLYSPLQTIYCQPYNPPTLEWKDGEGRPDPPFSNSVYDNAMLYVPSGCKSKYAEYAVSWGFHNIKEMDSGVEDVVGDESIVRVVDGSIVIDGVEADVPVEVYDMTGKAVYSGYAGEIPAMPRGIYIVRIGGKSVKVAV